MIAVPAEIERRILDSWDALPHRQRRGHWPSQRRLFWAVPVAAGALLLGFALPGHRQATVTPATPASSGALSVTRGVQEVHRSPQRTPTSHAVIAAMVNPVLDTETLLLVRVRMSRRALQAVGVVVSEAGSEGFVDVDVVVGEDGLLKDVRRVTLIQQ